MVEETGVAGGNNRATTNYKHTNRFSDHDNRHHFQEHGVYFGDGRNTRSLGRKIVSAQERLHFTEPSYLKHFCRNPTNIDFNTTYGVSYEGEAINKPPVHRRFPKSLKEPVPGTKPKLDTSTTDWFRSPDIPHRTPTHVLAVSQEPFLKQNFWKYSNNSLKKIYPPYNRKETMKVNNILNRYGAAYAS